MGKPEWIELPGAEPIPILYEDRSVLAVDKPAGWLLVPVHWQRTSRNLQAALESSLRAGDWWARSRGLRYLRFVHRLDADTSGVLLLAKSSGALSACSKLFQTGQVEKVNRHSSGGSAGSGFRPMPAGPGACGSIPGRARRPRRSFAS